MAFLMIQITKYISNDFPAFIECSFKDAHNIKQKIIDKVPVLTTKDINENTEFPIDINIPITIKNKLKDLNNKQILTINIEKPLGLESTDGETCFEVFTNQIVN